MSYFLLSIKCIMFGVVGVATCTCSFENYGSFLFYRYQAYGFLGVLVFFHISFIYIMINGLIFKAKRRNI